MILNLQPHWVTHAEISTCLSNMLLRPHIKAVYIAYVKNAVLSGVRTLTSHMVSSVAVLIRCFSAGVVGTTL